ncbi:methyltransferase domain-containing protein [Soonwooa sp.]|uniref:methyltransferase domain-containing protein n=1 Tax=Soonwooa sp. TaxID=1938592 RepID=UPI0035B4482F
MNTEENKNQDLKCCVTQCDLPLDKKYWDTRWENQETAWDVGYASTAITDYMDKIKDKNISILIPGCGNAYEAEYLLKNGFQNITLIDIAPKAVEILQSKFRNDPQIKVVLGDFFEHQGEYDLMLEQTFFCAIPPSMRQDYAKKSAELLQPNGKIVGVMFDAVFEHQGPPFGGCPCEYKLIFEAYFKIKKMEECYNSIPPRKGSEVFVELEVIKK